MNDESLSALAEEIERQNAKLEDVKNSLAALGDVQLEVPTTFLDDLDELAARRPSSFATPLNAVRA